jgi:hypothetical protein
MIRPLDRLRSATVLFATLTAACGGTAFVSDGSDSGTTGGDASAPVNPACPSQAPANNATCSTEQLSCEYGTSPYAQCNTIADCDDSKWFVTPPGADATNCGPSPDPSCPSTYASVPTGQACDPFGLECAYAEGTCGCTVPEGPPHVLADGGIDGPTWICLTPPTGCPAERPHLGTACSQEGLMCDYGTCTFTDGETEACVGGYWSSEGAACPAQATQ